MINAENENNETSVEKSTMKIKNLSLLAAALCCGLFAVQQARADITSYTFSYNGGGVTATGNLSLDGTFAVGGNIDITSGPVLGIFNLYTWATPGESSIRLTDGTDLIVNNQVNLASNPMMDLDGLAFVSSAVDSSGNPLEGLNLYGNGVSSYGLWGAGSDGYGVPNVTGSLDVAPAPVPEPVPLALAGLGFGALLLVQRHRRQIV
jgi:hypothetical protein